MDGNGVSTPDQRSTVVEQLAAYVLNVFFVHCCFFPHGGGLLHKENTMNLLGVVEALDA